MNDIEKIYKMLSWSSRFGDQLQGIKLARNLEDLSLLILPYANGESKSMWENCARALYEISDDRLEKYLPKLLRWLEDLNWPGALIIQDRLTVFSGKKLLKPFVERFNYLCSLNSNEGLIWIDHLSELLDNEELRNLLPQEIRERLEKHYCNWGFWSNGCN